MFWKSLGHWISLDQEKALDWVDHELLWKMMERFVFSPGFIAMICVLYYDIANMPKFNGSWCAPLCSLPWTPPLQDLCKHEWPGFTVLLQKNCFICLRDDRIIMARYQRNVDILRNLTVLFNRLSAAKVNWHKSQAVAIGRWTNGLLVLPRDLAWWKDGLKYLGLFIGNGSHPPVQQDRHL